MNLIATLKKVDFRNPKIQAMIVIVLASIVFAFLCYRYIIIAKREKVAQLEVQYQQKQNELNNIYAMRPQLDKLREAVARMKVELDSLRSIFPDKKEIPKLINEITKVASRSGIFTNKFNPLPDVQREHYIENKYSMSVIGGYHELATFFSYLADFELIINLTSVTIKVNPGVANSIKEYEEHGGTIEAVVSTFTMTTFSSKK